MGKFSSNVQRRYDEEGIICVGCVFLERIVTCKVAIGKGSGMNECQVTTNPQEMLNQSD